MGGMHAGLGGSRADLSSLQLHASPTSGPLSRTDPRVEALIDAAARHPLGRDFLVDGALDSVAATFSVHAFVVDAARDRLIDAAARSMPPAVEVPAAPLMGATRLT